MGTRRGELAKVETDSMKAKQILFVEEYLRCWKAKEAAQRAGYSEKYAAQVGSRLLKRTDVKALIRERLGEQAMGTDEVLARLAEQARGNLSDFLLVEEVDGKEQVRFDWGRLVREGKGYLLKAVTVDGVRVEFYDAQRALAMLAKQLGALEPRGEAEKKPLTLEEWERIGEERLLAVMQTMAKWGKVGDAAVEGDGLLLEAGSGDAA